MKSTVSFRLHRWRRALAVGSIVTVWAGFVFPAIGVAATVVTYKDKFQSISFAGSDGTAAWPGPWAEIGESDGPTSGAVQVESDSPCASGSCLEIGAEDPNDAGAQRTFDSNGATSVVLTFDYVRHVTSSGSGSGGAGVVKLYVSSDGASWTLVDTFPMNVDDGSPIAATYDLTGFAGTTSAVKFDLTGGIDDGHISIDNVAIAVSVGGSATTTSSTTTSSPTASTTSTTAITTTTTLATITTASPTTTTTPPPKATTSTSAPPRTTTTTAIALGPTVPRLTTTTTAPAQSSPTTAPVAEDPSAITAVAPMPTPTEALIRPSTGAPSFTPEEMAEAKENLVVAVPPLDQDLSVSDGEVDPRSYRLDPREGLAVSFASAVETLKGNLINSILLGVIISILLLFGIDKREERSSLSTSLA